MEEHVTHCKDVFESIKKENVKIKVTKCSFVHSEVKVPGHFFNAAGVKMGTYKIRDIFKAPDPKKLA